MVPVLCSSRMPNDATAASRSHNYLRSLNSRSETSIFGSRGAAQPAYAGRSDRHSLTVDSNVGAA
jgi:hypothetical protein